LLDRHRLGRHQRLLRPDFLAHRRRRRRQALLDEPCQPLRNLDRLTQLGQREVDEREDHAEQQADQQRAGHGLAKAPVVLAAARPGHDFLARRQGTDFPLDDPLELAAFFLLLGLEQVLLEDLEPFLVLAHLADDRLAPGLDLVPARLELRHSPAHPPQVGSLPSPASRSPQNSSARPVRRASPAHRRRPAATGTAAARATAPRAPGRRRAGPARGHRSARATLLAARAALAGPLRLR
jgi:hypothetical protein